MAREVLICWSARVGAARQIPGADFLHRSPFLTIGKVPRTRPSRWTTGGRPPCAHWPAICSPPSPQGADWFSIWSGRPSAEQSCSDPRLISRMILRKVRTPPSGLFPGRFFVKDLALSYSKFEIRPGRSTGRPRGVPPLGLRITGGPFQFSVAPTSRIDVAAWAHRAAGLYCEFLAFVARIKSERASVSLWGDTGQNGPLNNSMIFAVEEDF